MLTRRTALAAALAVGATAAEAAADDPRAADAALADLEQRHGGRLGVVIWRPADGLRIARRADERFAMCSTFKTLAAAAVLARVDRGREDLERRVVFGKDQVVTYSPVTGPRVGGDGMTLAEICAAAIRFSDNTAGNLLLDSLGGPAGLTRFARGLGDEITRLDRYETLLNEATPGDPRDTTSPDAMARNLRKLLLGPTLSSESRRRLSQWMASNTTGDARIRRGIPTGWVVMDKTGAGENGANNDVAVILPPSGRPAIVTVYYAESQATGAQRNAVIADVARVAARALAS
ncbi:MAG: class A beta-lactamase [Phenylobacterium sp. RIFCSPHIGHO2_01_FULL_69_31]|uniref:class A beta-lactamase n=1 Tax=Phenylobacterium sp. RIFCSPHIGHO2_01_FULL_69_31 TaxID=1801944 RepID=UPI0008AB56C3|nr:class A beta-lactamase [Phenylobacterium sp. RIFCSPHIGHO2_01_FULL_69_31]OHB29844.1 MAG: class A beta-lactamase [Phenylobacterium sp. RIFCSPHIGHO2_01_FULL_69_31]